MDYSKTKVKRRVIDSTQAVTTIAILTALSIVTSVFLTFRVGDFMKFSPAFIVIALAAKAYGVYGGVIVAFLTDYIQFQMAPLKGFSFGICLSNVLTGLIFGLFLYKKADLKRIIGATLSSQIICSLFISTYTMVYIERWYPTLFPLAYMRLLQVAIMSVASIIILYILFVKMDLPKKIKLVK